MFKVNGIIAGLFLLLNQVHAQEPASSVEVKVNEPQTQSTPTTTNIEIKQPTQPQTTPTSTPSTPTAPGTTAPNSAPATKVEVHQAPATDQKTTVIKSNPGSTTTVVVPAKTPVIVNCEFQPGTGPVTEDTVALWSKNASIQAFNFLPETIDTQLEKLKTCFTGEGWQSFQDALTQSGNLSAIKDQKLSVKGIIDGQVKISVVKENQWKAIIPMQITYQNDKDKLVQILSIELLIGRKTTGELGIMQIIATVRPLQPNT